MAALGFYSDLLLLFPWRSFVLKPSPKIKGKKKRLALTIAPRCSRRSPDRPPPDGPRKRISEQSSWESKDAEGKDYLYRLGQEADNMNIAVGARKGIVDDLFVGEFLGKDSDIVLDYRQKVTRSFEYLEGDYYIAPVFLDKIGKLYETLLRMCK